MNTSTKITLTEALIKDGLGSTGGITRKQMEFLGLEYPQAHGWKRRLIGKEILLENYQSYLALRNSSKKMMKATEKGRDIARVCQTLGVSESALLLSIGRVASEPKATSVPAAPPPQGGDDLSRLYQEVLNENSRLKADVEMLKKLVAHFMRAT